MSSVQRFLRQRTIGTRALSAGDLDNLYVFVAGAGNYVGNYPPGYMVKGSAAMVGFQGNAPITNVIMRDMGKTIIASVSTNGGVSVGTPGAFRQVQVLQPVIVASPTASTNFGVQGSVPGTLPGGGNAGDNGYNTFYIPEVLDGVLASTGAGSTTAVTQNSASLVPDGQL
jgi:hypothetical protein